MSSTLVLLGTVLAVASVASASSPILKPVNLRTEYHTNPLGIDAAHPRFSWLLLSEAPAVRGQAQSAYQIIVASAKDKLNEKSADLWNTGKLLSDQTNQIVYNGQNLHSGQMCCWSVRTWNGAGDASGWSEPAFFSMGLLHPEDWTAKWIGYDAEESKDTGHIHGDPTVNLDECHWIWTDETPPNPKVDDAFFRKSIEVPADRPLRAVNLMMTADNRFELYINGQKTLSGNDLKNAYAETLTNQIHAGKNVIAVKVNNTPDSPAGLVLRLRVDFREGDPIIVETDSSWKVSRKPGDHWENVDLDDAGWKTPKIVAKVGEEPFGTPQRRELVLPPPPYLRKTFTTEKSITRATLYATALGLYEMRINGKRVGDLELAPGWTDYHKRVHYNTYDVTNLVQKGRNAIGAILGDGWYEGYLGYTFKRHNYGGDPRLRAQLEIEFDDGTRETVITDESWKASYGPLREADLLMGCTYDATREKSVAGYDTPDFDDSAGKPVVTDSHDIPVQAHPGDPVKRIEELAAQKMTEPRPGVFVFDLGQNMVGWCRLRLAGSKDHPIVIRYSEMLNPDGTPYTVPLRAARATDTYIPASDATVSWEPTFTFHGFRYVEITVLSSKASAGDVTGIVVGSAFQQTGTFECSNKLVNQLFHNIIWGQKGNYLEVPTDCPQRDERLGWTGDAQFFVPTASYNFDVAAFFSKWLVDLVEDSQMKNGGYTHVAPALSYDDGGGTAWQDAAPICTHRICLTYNDTKVIRDHYASLTRYMQYLHDTSKDFTRNDKPFGDWLNLNCPTKSEVIGTAYYAHIAQLMSEMAGAIGKQEDAHEYAELAKKIWETFRKNFVNEDGSIKESSQTGYALAFTMGLIPPELRSKSAQKFVKEIEKKDWHLATGFIGARRLLPALTAAGRSDVAYRLLLTDTYPSWLYPVTLGATTMWERWDGWRPDKGFQDPAMNSFNHYAFGSVGQWMYESCAGIAPETPGYRRIRLQPVSGDGLEFAQATFQSINGQIVSSWRKKDGRVEYGFTVPPNTIATAELSCDDVARVREGDEPLAEAKGVKLLAQREGRISLELMSGHYRFSVPR